MANRILVEIITPSRTILSDKFSMVVACSLDGELGILSDHMPLISSLIEGPVRLKKDDGTQQCVSICGGLMEVLTNTVTILTPSAELASEIDAKRAEAAKERAQKRLTEEKVDKTRAEASLRRAIARLKTLEVNHK